jgi:Flp pilus assembly protein TadG
MLVLLGFAALVVDVGYAYYAQRSLQSSADAAALAGAQELPDVNKAKTVALQYSASAGNKNEQTTLNGVTTTVTTKCIVSLGGCAPMNAVVVLEQAPTKTFFAGLLGFDTFNIKAKATAAMRGGMPKPAHVMIVLDRTGSMSTPCTAGGTKIKCAKDGLNAFLGAMNPAYDKVGLIAFPPSNGNACAAPKGTNGPTTDYDAYPNGYLLVPLSNDYKTSPTATQLNPASSLVSTINCVQAGGTTVFAAAIDKARTTLAANHDPEAQDVMIFMTDGEANYGACTVGANQVCTNNTGPTSAYRTNPCKQGVTSADLAADSAHKVWIFGIAYDTPSAGCLGWKATGTGLNGASCNQKNGFQFVCAEVPAITANTAVKAIASDDGKFYSQPNPSSLTTLFKSIAAELTEGRLYDDDAT